LAVPICTRAAIHLIGRVVSLRSRAALASLPGSLRRRVAFLVDGLQPAPFHLPLELLTPRCGVLPNAVLAQQAVDAHGARHEPNHVRPPPASQTAKTASPPLPPLSGRFTRTNLRFDPFRGLTHFVTHFGAQVRLLTAVGILAAKVRKVDLANDIVLLKAKGQFAPRPIAANRASRIEAPWCKGGHSPARPAEIFITIWRK
jgi:hypothetical protein